MSQKKHDFCDSWAHTFTHACTQTMTVLTHGILTFAEGKLVRKRLCHPERAIGFVRKGRKGMTRGKGMGSALIVYFPTGTPLKAPPPCPPPRSCPPQSCPLPPILSHTWARVSWGMGQDWGVASVFHLNLPPPATFDFLLSRPKSRWILTGYCLSEEPKLDGNRL